MNDKKSLIDISRSHRSDVITSFSESSSNKDISSFVHRENFEHHRDLDLHLQTRRDSASKSLFKSSETARRPSTAVSLDCFVHENSDPSRKSDPNLYHNLVLNDMANANKNVSQTPHIVLSPSTLKNCSLDSRSFSNSKSIQTSNLQSTNLPNSSLQVSNTHPPPLSTSTSLQSPYTAIHSNSLPSPNHSPSLSSPNLPTTNVHHNSSPNVFGYIKSSSISTNSASLISKNSFLLDDEDEKFELDLIKHEEMMKKTLKIN